MPDDLTLADVIDYHCDNRDIGDDRCSCGASLEGVMFHHHVAAAIIEAVRTGQIELPGMERVCPECREPLHDHPTDECRWVDLASCPYYGRYTCAPGHDPEGTCSFQCIDEPACVTCGPLDPPLYRKRQEDKP